MQRRETCTAPRVCVSILCEEHPRRFDAAHHVALGAGQVQGDAFAGFAETQPVGAVGDDFGEAEIKEETKATVRVLPDEEFRSPDRPTTCMWCGKPATTEALWAKAY